MEITQCTKHYTPLKTCYTIEISKKEIQLKCSFLCWPVCVHNDFSGIRIMWHYWPDSLIERLDCLHCNCQEIDGENGYKKSISLPGRGSRISESNFPLKCVLVPSGSSIPTVFPP